jgi:hypothetical protein
MLLSDVLPGKMGRMASLSLALYVVARRNRALVKTKWQLRDASMTQVRYQRRGSYKPRVRKTEPAGGKKGDSDQMDDRVNVGACSYRRS